METIVAQEPIFIPLNRGKMGIFLVIMLALLGGCVWGVTVFGTDDDNMGLVIFAALCGLIFLYGSILLVRRLLDKKAGLWVAPDGVTYKVPGESVGFVPWGDVERVFMTSVSGSDFGGDLAGNYFIMLKVKGPETYIGRQKSVIRKQIIKGYMKRYGTPIAFSAKTLDIDRNELLQLLQNTFRVSRGEEPQSNYRPF